MNIEELKQSIDNGTVNGKFKIFVLEDESSRIISRQYVKAICSILNLNPKCIDDLSEIPEQSFISDDNLYIINVDEWSSNASHDNCIVICKKCKDKTAIKINKLQDWQVLDYGLTICDKLNKANAEWLLKQCGDNYAAFISELEKISLFKEQDRIFNLMGKSGDFNKYTSLNIWDLSNAVLQKDVQSLKRIMTNIGNIDVDGLGLATILYNNFKKVIAVQTNPKVRVDDLGITDKQLWAIKKFNCNKYTDEELVDIFELLTNIEILIDFKGLDKSNIIDYLVTKIVGGK